MEKYCLYRPSPSPIHNSKHNNKYILLTCTCLKQRKTSVVFLILCVN